MKADIEAILYTLPSKVAWSDVVQSEHINVRVLTVNHLFGDIIGVGEGYIEWCPNDDPPSVTETLLWWWVVRPDLGAAIAYEATEEIREAIVDYIQHHHC